MYRASASSQFISGVYGASMRDAYCKNYDSTSEIKIDDDNNHVHYFDSSELLNNHQKYALIGYKRLPEWTGSGSSWNSATVEQLEELYFNTADDEILFGFDNKYDAPFKENFTAVQVVKPISVYKDIYGKVELTDG